MKTKTCQLFHIFAFWVYSTLTQQKQRKKGVLIIYGEGGLANGRGGQAKFTPLFRGGGGGSERFYSGSGKEGGGQKSLKVDVISFGFFLNSSRTAWYLMYLYHSKSNYKIQQC